MVAPDPLMRSASASTEVTAQQPDAQHPVAATAELLPHEVRPGERLDLVIRVTLSKATE
jgi:hypothetical protein